MIVLRPPLFKDRITVGCSAPFVTKFKGSLSLNKGVAWTVADAVARLSLIGLSVGDKVLQIDDGLTYQYNAPATTQDGAFVSGGTQDGVYTKRGISDDKDFFNLLGVSDNKSTSSITWVPGVVDSWRLRDQDGVDQYYAPVDVATPDLVHDWKNASDDMSAAINVVSVSVGELVAGLRIGADTYKVNSDLNGRNKYSDVLAVATDTTWDTVKWAKGIISINHGNVAFPWQGTPDVVNARNDIASEANWSVV